MNCPSKIELRSIAELSRTNPALRQHPEKQVLALADSLSEFGFVTPVLISATGDVVDGHAVLAAAERLGWTEAPCVLVEHLSEVQLRAYRLACNRLAEMATWNAELLEAELHWLADNGFDIKLTGFEEELLLEPVDVQEDDCDLSPPAEPVTKLGDIWQLGRHRLMCGDSTSLDDVSKLMNGALAEFVFTDPPWNVNYGANVGNHPTYKKRTILNDFMGTEAFAHFLAKAFDAMESALKPGAIAYVVMSQQEWGRMMNALEATGFHWSSTIIWNKDSHVLSRKDYHTKYEPIWYGWKAGTRLCPLKDRKQSDVWDIPRPKKSVEHPTMKPVELVARAIQNSSKPDDNVLDLFGGSGSTLIACEQIGRSCYMMELAPEYCDVIIRRWEAFNGGKAKLLT